MTKKKTGFWRGFTWKRFARGTFYCFLFSFVASILWRLVDPAENVAAVFEIKSIIARILTSLLLGFLYALWFEPGIDNDKTVPPVVPF